MYRRKQNDQKSMGDYGEDEGKDFNQVERTGIERRENWKNKYAQNNTPEPNVIEGYRNR